MCDLTSTNQIFRELSDGGPAKACGKLYSYLEHISISGRTNDCPTPTLGGESGVITYHQVAGWSPEGMVPYPVLSAGWYLLLGAQTLAAAGARKTLALDPSTFRQLFSPHSVRYLMVNRQRHVCS